MLLLCGGGNLLPHGLSEVKHTVCFSVFRVKLLLIGTNEKEDLAE